MINSYEVLLYEYSVVIYGYGRYMLGIRRVLGGKGYFVLDESKLYFKKIIVFLKGLIRILRFF